MSADDQATPRGPIGVHQIPNLLSVLRILAVGPVIWFLHVEAWGTALVVAFVAAATDGLDGYLARRFQWRSRLGGLLDPLADKLLQVSCYVMLTVQGHLPPWLLGLVLGRDLLIVSGAIAYHVLVAKVSGEPTLISKGNTLLQIGLIFWVLVDLGVMALPDTGLVVLTSAVALTTVVSGIQYVGIWGGRALAARGKRQEEDNGE